MSVRAGLGSGAMLLAGALGCAGTGAFGKPAGVVDEATLRAEIERYVCAAVLDDYAGVQVMFGEPRCTTEVESTSPAPVRAAVRQAIEDSQWLRPLADAGYEQAYLITEAPVGRSEASLDEGVRAAYWNDPHLGAAAFARAVQQLAAAGIECRDCPAADEPSARVFTWEQLLPYLRAWVWPVDDPASAGVQVYVCGGINGIESLGLGEDRLAVDVGHLAALSLVEDRGVNARMQTIIAGSPEVSLAEVEVAIAEVLDSPAARWAVCRMVEDHAWFTGAVLSDC